MVHTVATPGLGSISQQAILRAALATDFRSFVQYVFGVLRPGIEFRPNWHIDAMAYKLSQVATGEVKRLIITVPPRNLKSICASVALPAWFLGRHPSERVVAISYSAELAKTHTGDFRRVVDDPIYQSVFPDMRVARANEQQIATTLRGRRYATSIDGTLTGLGGNLFIIDDPIKLGDAFSEVVRKRTIDWYRETLLTRLDDKKNARIVVLMQRVHQQDLVGYLQDQNSGFEVLNLPAIDPTGSAISTGPGTSYFRSPGELLHPDHEPEEVLLTLRKGMGSMAFLAQYQQTPVSAEGTFIKSKWLKSCSEIVFGPKDQIVMSWDIALSEAETGDFSAGVVLLNRGQTFYVLEVLRGRFLFPQLVDKIVDMCTRYRGALLIEDSPISKGLIQALRNKNVNVVTVIAEKEKRSRVIAQSDLFEGGSIFIKEPAEWREIFVRELLDFPGGRHDDQVDALVQGLAYQRGQWLREFKVRPTTGY
jgi:predicted phage terminase large subunit-like protein